MAYCDVCGNFDKSYLEDGGFNQEWKDAREKFDEDYQPNLYYFWDGDFCEEDYDWREHYPKVDCMCEICFGIANQESKVKWNCTNL